MTFLLAAWLLQAHGVALENEYVRVMRDAAPCASATAPGCGDRVIVALGEMELRWGSSRREMTRGDVAVYGGAMAALILVGAVGSALHVLDNLTSTGEIVGERFLRGAPFLAPLLFANMGTLGLIVLLEPSR